MSRISDKLFAAGRSSGGREPGFGNRRTELFAWGTVGVFLLCVSVIAVWTFWFRVPLPRDEVMFTHFEAHRAELEWLVQGYREFATPPSDPKAFYEGTEDVREVMHKAEVYHVVAAGRGGVWLPEPYSEQSLRRLGQILSADYRTAHPDEFEMPMYAPNRLAPVLIALTGAERGEGFGAWTLRYFSTGIWKGYMNFPQVPRIRDGKLLEPDSKLQVEPTLRVFDSLDAFPSDWKRGECVLRRITDKWFLAMCRTY